MKLLLIQLSIFNFLVIISKFYLYRYLRHAVAYL